VLVITTSSTNIRPITAEIARTYTVRKKPFTQSNNDDDDDVHLNKLQRKVLQNVCVDQPIWHK
jgi:hypothetical protein